MHGKWGSILTAVEAHHGRCNRDDLENKHNIAENQRGMVRGIRTDSWAAFLGLWKQLMSI